MSYQGITLAIGLLVGVGTLIYHLYNTSLHSPERPYREEPPKPSPRTAPRNRRRRNVPRDKCSICLEATDDIVELPCGHTFHRGCLWNWCSQQRTCPNCRAKININELTNY